MREENVINSHDQIRCVNPCLKAGEPKVPGAQSWSYAASQKYNLILGPECARVCAHGGMALSSQGRFVSTDVGHKQLVAKGAKLAGKYASSLFLRCLACL